MADQGYTYLRTYRYERKFLVEGLMPFQAVALIKQHPRLFRSTFPPRYVNNLYLDTPEMVHYFDNVNGAMQRRKVRVRWYGEPFGEIKNPMLEVKRKNGDVGTKYTFPLSSFRLDRGFCDHNFQRVLAESNLPQSDQLALRGLTLVLFNRYFRRYYATHDGAYRLTLDTHLAFYKVNGLLGNQFLHCQPCARDIVIELKYEAKQDPLANRVSSFFPFRMTRNSKFVQGIERVYF